MRKTIQNVALTLASCGALAAPAVAGSLEQAHDDLRTRIRAEVKDPDADADEVRARLRDDPAFDRLLEHFRKASLAGAPPVDGAEDAAQETLLKMWKGRPGVFLRPHDEVVRYVKSATRRNLWTATDRAKKTVEREAQVESTEPIGPAATAEAHDLLESLVARVDRQSRDVLDHRLSGFRSVRSIANDLDRTRHSVDRSDEQIETTMAVLLEAAPPEPAE